MFRADVSEWLVVVAALSVFLAIPRSVAGVRRRSPLGTGGRGHGASGRSQSRVMPAPMVIELIASLLESGAPPAAAVRSVAIVLDRDGDQRAIPLVAMAGWLDRGSDSEEFSKNARSQWDSSMGPLAEALRLAVATGLPPASLVRRAAAEGRRRQDAAQRSAIRRLEVLLVLPIGLCLLPAFVFLGIIPVVIDLVMNIS